MIRGKKSYLDQEFFKLTLRTFQIISSTPICFMCYISALLLHKQVCNMSLTPGKPYFTLCISQDRLGYAVVTNKLQISVASHTRLYVMLLLYVPVEDWAGVSASRSHSGSQAEKVSARHRSPRALSGCDTSLATHILLAKASHTAT